MKYMILIQSNPQFLERWQALPKEQRERFGRDHLALSAELAESGELVASEGLADPALAPAIDDSNLQQVVVNLLDNAIKYTAEGGRVTVTCSGAGQEYALSIMDTGGGIPADLQPRIFERFFRADKARSRAENDGGGAGLGLSISRWIAEAHHGRLELTRSDSIGSTFTAYFPAAPFPSASSG